MASNAVVGDLCSDPGSFIDLTYSALSSDVWI